MDMESEQTITNVSANIAVNPNVQPLASSSSSSVTNQCTPQQPTVTVPPPPTNVVTIPVPIVHNEGTYTYVTVKGSLHDRSCSVFGLNDTEIQALSKRFESGIKSVVNGVMVAASPMTMMNTLAQLSYKVICSCGEAEICWTMQREI